MTVDFTNLRFIGGVKSPGISAITIPDEIYFPSKDMANNPARIFIAVAYPMDGSNGQIKLAAELEKNARRQRFFKSALINSTSAEEFINFIRDKETGNFSAAKSNDIQISAPLNGQIIPLNQIGDNVFSSGAMGRGIGIKNPEGKVYAPFDGEINLFVPTHHAIGLKSNDGIELLIHVGIDTVKLNGNIFRRK